VVLTRTLQRKIEGLNPGLPATAHDKQSVDATLTSILHCT